MDPTRLLRPGRDRDGRPGGAPIALPPVLDRGVEAWWRLRPRTRAVVAAVVVVGALGLVGRGATASPWGPARPVLVAATDLAAGQVVTVAQTRATTWPAGLVPDDAVAVDDLAGDVRVAGPVVAGTPLTRRHLATGVAGLVDGDDVAVAVPVDGLPTVRPGDLVDVVATGSDGLGRRVVTGARVVAREEGFLWLGVPGDAVDAVAGAGATGQLALAVRRGAPTS